MVYMHHNALIHSSADGHLGCFHVLAIVNSAAVNTGVHVSLSIPNLSIFSIFFARCFGPASVLPRRFQVSSGYIQAQGYKVPENRVVDKEELCIPL